MLYSGSSYDMAGTDAVKYERSATKNTLRRNRGFALPYCPPKLTVANTLLANKLSSPTGTREMVRPRVGYVPPRCTICSAMQAAV